MQEIQPRVRLPALPLAGCMASAQSARHKLGPESFKVTYVFSYHLLRDTCAILYLIALSSTDGVYI